MYKKPPKDTLKIILFIITAIPCGCMMALILRIGIGLFDYQIAQKTTEPTIEQTYQAPAETEPIFIPEIPTELVIPAPVETQPPETEQTIPLETVCQNHLWSDWEIHTMPTVDMSGWKYRICLNCQEEEWTVIPMVSPPETTAPTIPDETQTPDISDDLVPTDPAPELEPTQQTEPTHVETNP